MALAEQQPSDEGVIRAAGEVITPGAEPPDAEAPERYLDRAVSSAMAASGQAVRFFVAFAIAILADAVQLVLLPLFGEGIASPLNDALDVMVALLMYLLLGFHWQFLPSFFAELVPVLNVAPAWTISVLWVFRSERHD